MVKLVDKDNKWATEIGRMFVSFGHIESCTYKCIEAFADPRVVKHLNNQSLSRRIEILKDLVVGIDSIKENQDQFIKTLNEIKEISEKRNLIAHSPLVLHIFSPNSEGVSLAEKIISDKKQSKQIEFKELETIASKSERLSTELHKIMALLRGQGFST
ncbi:hypothetical protein [Vibrio parahaemolyticus]|uniref:hypothetical protein n=1 Tax=Vibrio parahaemolyticus TaxID=670 RepID=UPI00226A246E|nr:hypothetical protein [Vibrio parahaemolyticus]MCX8760989.1 hypothetical protein [Vibrio parahaemolyticus]